MDLPREPHSLLTPHQFRVFMLIARGKDRQAIARELVRHPRTIDMHRRAVLQKMGMRGNADVIRYAHHRGLLVPGEVT